MYKVLKFLQLVKLDTFLYVCILVTLLKHYIRHKSKVPARGAYTFTGSMAAGRSKERETKQIRRKTVQCRSFKVIRENITTVILILSNFEGS